MKTVAIVACSNGQKEEYRSQNEELARYLEKTGHKVLWSNDIYEKNAAFSGTGAERAAELMRFFNDPEVEEIYDFRRRSRQSGAGRAGLCRHRKKQGQFSGATAI